MLYITQYNITDSVIKLVEVKQEQIIIYYT